MEFTNKNEEDFVLDVKWLKMHYDIWHVWSDRTSKLWDRYMESETKSEYRYTLREHLARSIDEKKYQRIHRYDLDYDSAKLSNLSKKRAYVDAAVGCPDKTRRLLHLVDASLRERLLVQFKDMTLAIRSGCSNKILRHILCPRFESRTKVQKEIEEKGSSLDSLKKYI